MASFRKARSPSRRSAAVVAAGVGALFVCFHSPASFAQPPAATSRRLALGGAVAGATVSLTGPAWAKTSDGPVVTKDEVLKVQDAWKDAILTISKEYLANPKGEQFKNAAKAAAGELYGYGEGDVLFKPTKAKETPFRVKGEGALSYFIGYDAIKPAGFAEDKGFAINGGKGWKAVKFENSQISTYGDLALAQGEYFFTDFDDKTAKVEYSFGYKKTPEGKLKIVLHHSSIPYSR